MHKYSRDKLIDKANTWWVNEDWRIKEQLIYEAYIKKYGILDEEVN